MAQHGPIEGKVGGHHRRAGGALDSVDHLQHAETGALVTGIIVLIDVARNFGKDTGFALGLFFLGFIFFPIVGFGSAQYQGSVQHQGLYQ